MFDDPNRVIPVKTGIQRNKWRSRNWIPAYAGMTIWNLGLTH